MDLIYVVFLGAVLSHISWSYGHSHPLKYILLSNPNDIAVPRVKLFESHWGLLFFDRG